MKEKETQSREEIRITNAQKRIDHKRQEYNCLNCFITEMEVREIYPADMLEKGVDVDQVLEGICAERRQKCQCSNRVYFEDDPNLEKPHLGNLHAKYRIQEMCN